MGWRDKIDWNKVKKLDDKWDDRSQPPRGKVGSATRYVRPPDQNGKLPTTYNTKYQKSLVCECPVPDFDGLECRRCHRRPIALAG